MIRSTSTAVILLSTLSLFPGCANRRNLREMDCCAEIPAGHVPEPAGRKLCEWQSAQVANAEIDQRVLYRSNFIGDSTRLSQAAIDHLQREITTSAGLPWMVEPSGDEALDLARVERVTELLAELGSSPVVTIATPAALGLRGPQAERAAAGLSRGNRNTGLTGSVGQGSGIGVGSFR